MISWQLMHSGTPMYGQNNGEKETDITNKDKEIIYHTRKSLLFNEKDTWMKRQSGLFDVKRRAYDSGEVYELVGSYI